MDSGSTQVSYKEHAVRWIVEVLIISVIGGVINFSIVSGIGGRGSFFFSLGISLVVALVSGVLLFRHVDTLILKRIAQSQNDSKLSTKEEQ